MIDLTPIINAVIALLAAIITTFLIPWLKEKYELEKLNKLKEWVAVAVEAAEKLFEHGMNAEKKEYVLEFLAKKGYYVNTDDIDALIESAVYWLKHGELNE